MAAKSYWRILAVLVVCFAGGAAMSVRAATPWRLIDITGHLPDLRFSLLADTGEPVGADSYSGKVVLLYFGFAGCSAQCPVAMSRIASILPRVGTDADDIQVLFATITPENDTPAVLRLYLSLFDPIHIQGLTGRRHQIEALARRYRAAYRPVPGGNGNIPHSNVIYIFDKHGRARLLMTPDARDNDVVSDLRTLADDRG